MDSSSIDTIELIGDEPLGPDGVSVRRWFALYAALLAAAVTVLIVLIAREAPPASAWVSDFMRTLKRMPPEVKLLGFGIYVSFCCTFLPLPTGWIVAVVATREAAIAARWSNNATGVVILTTLAVAAVGAVGSTIANLNDYHLFTWMLRHHRVSKVRNTAGVRRAMRWFARSPFFLLVVFNLIPIPIDVIRILATTNRYPRLHFAGANFLGRFMRYAVIAFVTYRWDLGWIAVVSLLALAVALAVVRLVRSAWTRIENRPRRT